MNIAIKNINGINENVVVVRYFQFNGANYLIFTKNEVDESGYQKLYISKIVNMIGNSISDEVEWNLLRDTIKVIAKANKENTTLPVQDLNESEINGIQVVGEKPFKLTSASVALLSANKSTSTNVNLNTVTTASGIVPPAVPSTINSQPMQQVNTVPNNTVLPINNVSSSLSGVNIPNNDNNATMNTNGLPQNNVQNLNNEVSTNVAVEPVNTFEVFTNDGITSMPIEPALTSFTAPNLEPQIVTSNSSVVENNGGNNLQQTLYSDLQAQNQQMPEPVSNVSVVEPTFEVPTPTEPVIDYKKLYEEQILKLNTMTVELNQYKSIVEQLKNILN